MGCTERLREVSNELIQYPWIHVLPVCSARRGDPSPRSGALRSRPHSSNSDAAGESNIGLPKLQYRHLSASRQTPAKCWAGVFVPRGTPISYADKVHASVFFATYHYWGISAKPIREASTPANFADPVYPACHLDCLFYYVVKNASNAHSSLLFRHLRLNNNRRYTKFQNFRAIFNNLNKLW